MENNFLSNEYVQGIFKKELKNRFLCEVDINGESNICYVPSSCQLSNFLSLEGKKVLLLPVASKTARTKFSLFAVKYGRSYILLNTSLANRIVEKNISKRRFSFLGCRSTVIKEKTVSGYKTDLYVQDTNTIIEIKSVISIDKTAAFPSVYSERTYNQLKQLQELLKQGYNVYFVIISLSPYVNKIELDKSSNFYQEFMKCINLGMHATAFGCGFDGNNIVIKKKIAII